MGPTVASMPQLLRPRRTWSLALAVALIAVGSQLAAQTTGSLVRQIIGGPGLDIDVTLSADGKQFAYASSRGGTLEIWMRSVDGGPLHQVTTASANSADRYPNFTADGRSMIFQSDRGGGVRNIWMVELGSRALAQLTTFPDGGASHPALSPDGKSVCFTRTTAVGSVAIWVVGIDGRDARELTMGVDCAWMRDGRIVFSRPSDLQNPLRYDQWIIGADGKGGRALTTTAQPWSRNPVPSPDGRWLVYTAYEVAPSGDIREVSGGFMIDPSLRTTIWLASLTEPDRPHRQLVSGGGFNSYPTWTKNGRNLMFTSTRSGSADVWSVEVIP